MKKLLTILFLFISVSGIAQFDQKQTMGTSKTDVKSKGLFSADSGMVITNVLDTTTANRGYIKTIPGAHIKTSDNKEFYRNTTATAWIYIPDFIRVKSTINDSLNTLNMSLENGGPPGFDIFRQKNDSTIQGRSIYFPFGLIGDTTSFGDSIFAIKPDTAWFSSLYIRRADSLGFYITPKRLSDTAAAIRAAIGAGGITALSPWPYNINGAQHRLDSVKALLIGVAGTGVTENLMPNSEDQDNTTYWDNDGNVTITANAAVDFTGGTTMDQLNITNASGNVQRTTNGHPVVVVTGDTYYLTMDVKRGTLSSGVYCVRDVDNAADIIFTTLTIPAGATSVFTSPSFVVPAGCTHIYIYTARDVASTGTYFIGRVQVHHLGNTYIHTTTAPSPAAGSGGYLTAMSTDSVNANIGLHGAPDATFNTTEYGSVQFTSDSFYLPNLPSAVGNKILSFNTSTGKVTYAAATRFGVSGEDDVATQDRVFDGGTHVLQMNWRSPYDATQTLNFFPYYHVDGMHNIAEMRVQANQSGAGGSGNYLSVGVDNSSGVVLNAGDNTGEHKAILIRTDSVLVFTNNGATINTALAVSGTGAGLPAVSFPSIQKAASLGTHRVALIDTANKQISYINYDSLRTATSVPLSGITAPASTNIIAMGGFNFGLTGGNFGVGVTPSYRLDVLSSSAGVFAANITNNSSTGAGVGINTFSSSTETLFQLLSGALGSTSRLRMNANGHLQIGAGISPSALLQLDPGTAAPTTAPIKFTSGTVMSTPEAGALEYNNGLLMLDSSNSQRDTIATRKWARNNISGGGGSSLAIGSTITSATAGSVLFAGTGGTLMQKNSDFFYDSTNKRLGIGTASPSDFLDIEGANSSGATIKGSQPMLTLNATSNDPQITLTRAGNSSNIYVNSSAQLIVQGYNEIKAQQSGTNGWGITSYVGPSLNSAYSIGSTSNPTSTLQSYGSFATPYVAKTGTYTATDYDHTIDCTSGTFTVTLPTASGITGREYTIKNTGAGVITVGTTSGQFIDGTPNTSYTLPVLNKYVTVKSTNAGWIVIANN